MGKCGKRELVYDRKKMSEKKTGSKAESKPVKRMSKTGVFRERRKKERKVTMKETKRKKERKRDRERLITREKKRLESNGKAQ